MTQPGWGRRDGQAEERARLRADFERRLSLQGPVVGHDDLGALVRTVREISALSQRELADRCGVPLRALSRIEAEHGADARWSTVLRILRGTACRLQLLDPQGHPAVPWLWESGRDEGGRHVPAHLDVDLPFEASYERRVNAVRPRPRRPLFSWSLTDRPAPIRPEDPTDHGYAASADGDSPPGDGHDGRITHGPDGPMLGT